MRVRSADVVIVGAGIIGLSTAYHLVKRQPGLRVIVLEREPKVGTGATSKATGGIRHQFGTEVNIRLTQLSYPEFLRFPDEHGREIGFRAHGYLFLASSAESWRAVQVNVALQLRLGVPTRLLQPLDTRRFFPELRIDDLYGAAFCPLDASANPSDALQGYLSSARARGVEVICDAQVAEIGSSGGAITGIRAGDSRYASNVVVNAAGPYVAEVAALADVEVPARPFRRQVFVMAHDPHVPHGLPLTIDIDTGWYVHQEGSGRLLFGGTDKDNRPGLDPTVDWDGFEGVAAAASTRVPALAERARVVGAYAGIRTLTPDGHAIIGPVPGLSGLFVASACNGHGFMHAPAIGSLLAEEIVEGRTRSLNLSALSLTRFARGTPTDEPTTF